MKKETHSRSDVAKSLGWQEKGGKVVNYIKNEMNNLVLGHHVDIISSCQHDLKSLIALWRQQHQMSKTRRRKGNWESMGANSDIWVIH